MRERKAPVAVCRPHTRHSPWPSARCTAWGQPGRAAPALPLVCVRARVASRCPITTSSCRARTSVLNLEDGLQGGAWTNVRTLCYFCLWQGSQFFWVAGSFLSLGLSSRSHRSSYSTSTAYSHDLSDFLHSIYHSIQGWACFSSSHK